MNMEEQFSMIRTVWAGLALVFLLGASSCKESGDPGRTLLPCADMISTFSLACAPEEGIGQTNCENALYAGCMAASCAQTDDDEIANCQCPTYEGPYQVGNFGASCDLPAGLTWSAAYNPNEGDFTCDATLCTSTCDDQDLVSLACDGLASCDITAIAALEAEEGFSCCARQLCGG